MGSTISYNVNLERKGSQKKFNNHRSRQKRRDSAVRPVLKLKISSNTMERHHRINGETSLDHPFLKRLSSHKFSAVDPISSPSHGSVLSQRHSIYSITSNNSFTTPIVDSPTKSSTVIKSTIPHSANGCKSDSPPTSTILVKFVDNVGDRYSSSTCSLPERAQSIAIEESNENLILCDMDKTNRKKTHSTLSSDEYGQPVVTEHIEQQLVLNNMSMRYQRSQSVDELSQKNIGRKASVKISRKITRTSSLQNKLNEVNSNVDIQITLDDGGWSFGENVMKCLEAEGILLFNMENPQTSSEKDVDETWPGLKDKLKKWRSEQSLLDL